MKPKDDGLPKELSKFVKFPSHSSIKAQSTITFTPPHFILFMEQHPTHLVHVNTVRHEGIKALWETKVLTTLSYATFRSRNKVEHWMQVSKGLVAYVPVWACVYIYIYACIWMNGYAVGRIVIIAAIDLTKLSNQVCYIHVTSSPNW